MPPQRIRRFRIRPIVGERWRMRSVMNSGNNARGILPGTPCTSCDGTCTMNASGSLFRLCS
ncbi:hypothetical protein Y600_5901 [Burkholderia pseudomallei MSHR3709]|nr:hypothetical protein Y600_5901 [Burkholderia pseudomallei MSHR3709]